MVLHLNALMDQMYWRISWRSFVLLSLAALFHILRLLCSESWHSRSWCVLRAACFVLFRIRVDVLE